MPYDVLGLFSNTPPQTGRRVCGVDLDLGEVLHDDVRVVFRDCPVSVCHAGVIGGLWLQPVRRDDVAPIVITAQSRGPEFQYVGHVKK